MTRDPGDLSLTPAETEVYNLLMQGMTNKEIAGVRFTSERTTEGHVEKILKKAGVSRRRYLFVKERRVVPSYSRDESIWVLGRGYLSIDEINHLNAAILEQMTKDFHKE